MFEIQTGNMPARQRAFKSHARTKPVAKSRRDLSKFRRRAPSKVVRRVRTSPVAPPNQYSFRRDYDNYAVLGTTSGIYSMNTDSVYQIVTLKTKFNELPAFTEFCSLFSEYKIKAFTITLTPTFSNNQPVVLTSGDLISNKRVANFEVIAIPANYTDDEVDFASMTGTAITDYINQSQRKKISVMPSSRRVYHTPRPKVVKYEGAVTKVTGTSTTAMGNPYWMSTCAPTGEAPDERAIEHYGMKLLIRHVDGSAITSTSQTMGFRVHHSVDFMMRKVQ